MILCHPHSPWFSTASAAPPPLPGCPCPPLAGLRAGPDRPPSRRAGAAAPSGQGSRAGTAGCDAHTAGTQFSDQPDGRSLRPQRACRSEGPGGRRQGRSLRGQRGAGPSRRCRSPAPTTQPARPGPAELAAAAPHRRSRPSRRSPRFSELGESAVPAGGHRESSKRWVGGAVRGVWNLPVRRRLGFPCAPPRGFPAAIIAAARSLPLTSHPGGGAAPRRGRCRERERRRRSAEERRAERRAYGTARLSGAEGLRRGAPLAAH